MVSLVFIEGVAQFAEVGSDQCVEARVGAVDALGCPSLAVPADWFVQEAEGGVMRV
jgi:hypothetical protein